MNAKEEVRHSAATRGMDEQETRGNDRGRPESLREFLDRVRGGIYEVFTVGGISYARNPVGPYDTSKFAEGIAAELTALGIEHFYHNGLEWNENGKALDELVARSPMLRREVAMGRAMEQKDEGILAGMKEQ